MIIQNIEGFRKNHLPSANKGDSVGLLLSGQEKFRLKKGLYLAAGDGEIELNRLMNEKGNR